MIGPTAAEKAKKEMAAKAGGKGPLVSRPVISHQGSQIRPNLSLCCVEHRCPGYQEVWKEVNGVPSVGLRWEWTLLGRFGGCGLRDCYQVKGSARQVAKVLGDGFVAQ